MSQSRSKSTALGASVMSTVWLKNVLLKYDPSTWDKVWVCVCVCVCVRMCVCVCARARATRATTRQRASSVLHRT
jgi:hypothetical protein